MLEREDTFSLLRSLVDASRLDPMKKVDAILCFAGMEKHEQELCEVSLLGWLNLGLNAGSCAWQERQRAAVQSVTWSSIRYEDAEKALERAPLFPARWIGSVWCQSCVVITAVNPISATNRRPGSCHLYCS